MPDALADAIDQWDSSKKVYTDVKQRLKGHWDESAPIQDGLELAAHYWFNHNLSYGPGFLGWMSGIYEDKERVGRLVDKVRAFVCGKLRVECAPFAISIPRHPTSFLYCDPPYYLDGDSKMFRGIYP